MTEGSVSLHPSLCRRQLLHRNDPDKSRIENRSAQHRSIRRLHFNKVPGNARLLAMVRSHNRRHRERAQAEEMEPGEEGGLHSGRLCSVEGTGLAPVIASFNLHGRSIGLAQNWQRGSHGSPATCCCLIAQLNRNVVEAYPMTQYQSVQARCLRLLSKAADAASIAPVSRKPAAVARRK